ncbi:LON peptidase N-terminal domain and RING finger protein 3 [Caerostris extrusa]|uniref:LON peptidase N-terminal domain and RING finger protein 3 n=1 Tax=Caerostris extrusa TaxID=172846 RepID=A0AAV4QPG9_CAEEX|nr:LON peptidase N-terminal domain and RING finger protein 3 [Caerostris extrusa]
MGESDLQAVYNKNDGKCSQNFDREIQGSATVDLLKDVVKSYLKCNKFHDALNAYINAYSSDFLDATCLEIFVDGLIEKSREIVTKDVNFNVNFFQCSMCCDVMTDPVTLKCGHTYSKKCILPASQRECFNFPYWSQEKYSSCFPDIMHGSKVSTNTQKNAPLSETETDLSMSQTFSPMAFLRKGDLLVKFEKYEEAIKCF